MINRDRAGELFAECDDCGTEKYGGVLSFESFVGDLKHAGWTITKDGEDWIHHCPDCIQE